MSERDTEVIKMLNVHELMIALAKVCNHSDHVVQVRLPDSDVPRAVKSVQWEYGRIIMDII